MQYKNHTHSLGQFLTMLSLLGLLFLNACQESNPSTKKTNLTQSPVSTRIPVLLERPANLGTEAERQQLEQTYSELVADIQAQPKNYRKQLQLAQLFMLEARVTGEHGHYYPASLKVLNQVLAENPPKDVEFGASSLKASVYLSLHEFEKAKSLAEYAASLNGYNAVVVGSLVDANVELGNYAEAVKMSDKMVSLRPDLRSYSRVSYLREIHGDMEGAIEAMKMAVQAGFPPYEETAWCKLTLGQLYEKVGEIEKAEKMYQQILVDRPNYPFAIAQLAALDFKRKDYKAAEEKIEKAIALIPEVSFCEQKAELYMVTGREQEAEQIVSEVIAMLEDDEAHGHIMNLEWANVYLNLKQDYSKALEYAQKEYVKRKDNIDVNRLLSTIYLQMGKYEEAAKHLQKAKQTDAQYAELLCLEGMLCYKKNDSKQAVELIQRSFNLDPFQQHIFAEEARKIIQS